MNNPNGSVEDYAPPNGCAMGSRKGVDSIDCGYCDNKIPDRFSYCPFCSGPDDFGDVWLWSFILADEVKGEPFLNFYELPLLPYFMRVERAKPDHIVAFDCMMHELLAAGNTEGIEQVVAQLDRTQGVEPSVHQRLVRSSICPENQGNGLHDLRSQFVPLL